MFQTLARFDVQTKPPHRVFEDTTGRQKRLVTGGLILVLIAVAIFAVDFVVRLRAMPPPASPDAVRQIVSSMDDLGVPDRADLSITSLALPSGAMCDGGQAEGQTSRRTVAAYIPAGNGTSAQAFAQRCGMVDLALVQTMSIDVLRHVVSALPQPVLATFQDQTDAPPFYHVISLRTPVSADQLEQAFGAADVPGGLIEQIADQTTKMPVGGVCLDLTPVPEVDPAVVAQTLNGLRARLGTGTCVIGPLDAPFWNDAGLVSAMDLAVARAFVDPDRPTVALARPDWLDANLAQLSARVPADKLVIALGTFGQVWQSGRAVSEMVTYAEAMERVFAAQAGPDIAFVPELGAVRIRFVDALRQLNDIWLQDAAVFQDQVRRLSATQAVAVWPLGYEDPTVWPLLEAPPTTEAALQILGQPISLANLMIAEGDGPFLTRTESDVLGRRSLTWDRATGAILSVSYSVVPSPNRVHLSGAGSSRTLHLTFDGLPAKDPADAILSALSNAGVKATFFVDSLDIFGNEDALDAVLAEGHAIGFRQPQSALAGFGPGADLRHNTAQLAMSHATGLRSLFVRPAAEIAQPSDLAAYDEMIERGYLAVAPGVFAPHGSFDPADFVGRVRDAAADNPSGLVGFELGPNAAAVGAILPAVLSGLKLEGFDFASLADAAGIVQAEAMPLTAEPSHWRDGVALWSIGFYLVGLTTMFFVLMLFAAVRSVIYVALALWRGNRTDFDPDFCPPVTVIVPAYNEELVIVKCIESLLASDYPDLRIVVVDDGSTDTTYNTVLSEFGNDDRVIRMHQDNGGKWRAANLGLSVTNSPIFIIADADSIFFPNTIRWLVQQFKDEKVGAVAGLVEVGNRQNFITSCQSLEYIVSQSVMRRAYEVFEGVLVVPGAVGAWRTEAVREANSFSGETITEDADLTIAVHRAGYKVRFQEQARAVTEAPDKVRAFMRQRLRWTFGMIEVAVKHSRAITERRPVGISIIDAVWFGLVSSIMSPLVDLLLVLLVAKAIIGVFSGEAVAMSGLPVVVVASYFFLTALDVLNTLVAFRFERRFDWKLLAIVPLLRFGYRQLLYISTLNAIWHAMIGQMAGWNKLARTGAVFNPVRPAKRQPGFGSAPVSSGVPAE